MEQRKTVTALALAADGSPRWMTDLDSFSVIEVPEGEENPPAYQLFRANYIPEPVTRIGMDGASVQVFQSVPGVDTVYEFVAVVNLGATDYYIMVANLAALLWLLNFLAPTIQAALNGLEFENAEFDRQSFRRSVEAASEAPRFSGVSSGRYQ